MHNKKLYRQYMYNYNPYWPTHVKALQAKWILNSWKWNTP